MKKEVKNLEFIDLGLSVKWANMNVGAEKEVENGDYFSWKDVIESKGWDWSDYLSEKNGEAVDLGDNCRMPSEEEWKELIEKCTWEWELIEGVKGYKVTSRENRESIFLVASGCKCGEEVYFDGKGGYYLSNTVCERIENAAMGLVFRAGHKNMYLAGSYKRSVRLVKE